MKDILISKNEVIKTLVSTITKAINEIDGIEDDWENTPVYRCFKCGSIFEVYSGWRYCPICGNAIEKK